jgi:uncharacterized protein (DUF433 family)
MNWRERIESDPQTLHGKLRVRGTRIPVSVVLDNLAAHVDVREVLTSYPSLSEEDVRACLAWAAECSHAAEQTEEHATVEASPKEGAKGDAEAFWAYLMSIPNVGEDADFERPVSYGRPDIEWD